MLQLSNLFVFRQYEIDMSTQRNRRPILAPTCQDGCQVKRLYHGQSATVIWMTHIHRWWTTEKANGRRRNEKRLLQYSPRLEEDGCNPATVYIIHTQLIFISWVSNNKCDLSVPDYKIQCVCKTYRHYRP